MSDPSAYGLEDLFRLQSIEGRIRDFQAMTDRSKEMERVTQCQRILHDISEHIRMVKDRLQKAEKTLRRLELDLTTLEAEIAKNEQQMFDGSVSDARGLANIQERVVADRKRKDQLEEQALLVMEQIEQLKDRASKLDAQAQKADQAYTRAEDQLDQARAQWRDQMSALDIERNDLVNRIAPDLLKRYQSLAAKMVRPVAQVADRTCRGCNVTLPTSVKRPQTQEVLRCPHCGRLLWWPPS